MADKEKMKASHIAINAFAVGNWKVKNHEVW